MSTLNELFALPLEDFGERLNAVLSPAHAIKSPEFLLGRNAQLTEVRQSLANERAACLHSRLSRCWKNLASLHRCQPHSVVRKAADLRPVQPRWYPHRLIHDIVKQALPSDPTQVKTVTETNKSGGLGLWKFNLSAGMRSSVEQGKLPKPESVNDAVELLCFAMERHSKRPVVIIDEFDHMPKTEHIHVDLLIKKLAEVDELPLKIIICGIGETLESLFAAHLSTYRYFHTIKLDRLDLGSCGLIVLKALEALDVKIDVTTGWRITRISDGFPHFVHLLCEKILWAMYNDPDKQWLEHGFIELEHYRSGTSLAVQSASEELRKGYDDAVRKYSKNAEVILWAAADGHELRRKSADMFASYRRIMQANLQDPAVSGLPANDWRCRTLTEAQFRARIYNLCKDKYGQILSGNGRGWYEYSEKMMRGYARLKAESEGIELYPDHPLVPKRTNTLAEYMSRERFGA